MRSLAVAIALLAGCGALEVTVTRAAGDGGAVLDAPTSLRGDAGSPASCYRALGRVVRADGSRCGAVLIAPRVALTTAGCVLERAGGDYLPASALRFESHEGAEVMVERVVRGRDPEDPRAGGDWAALVLVRSAERATARVAALRGRERGLEVVGYADRGARALEVRADCDLARLDDDSVALERCDAPTLPGGVVMRCERGDALVHALTSRRDDPRERARYEAVPLDYAREAPLAPVTLAAGPATAFGPMVYAWDEDTRRIHLRARDGERWLPWQMLDLEVPTSVALGATGLRVVDLPHLVFLGVDRTLRHIWSDWTGATRFRAVDRTMSPAPGAAGLRDLAVTGDAARPTELYLLDAAGTVWSSRRAGDADQAPWSRWSSLGVVPEAERIAAFVQGEGEDARRVVAVRAPDGVHLRASRAGYLRDPWPPNEPFARAALEGDVRGAMAFAQTRDDATWLLAAGAEGDIVRRSSAADARVGPEARFEPRPGGPVRAMAAARMRDRRAMLVAVVRAAAPGVAGGGEILVLPESERASGFVGQRWQRFYR